MILLDFMIKYIMFQYVKAAISGSWTFQALRRPLMLCYCEQHLFNNIFK